MFSSWTLKCAPSVIYSDDVTMVMLIINLTHINHIYVYMFNITHVFARDVELRKLINAC